MTNWEGSHALKAAEAYLTCGEADKALAELSTIPAQHATRVPVLAANIHAYMLKDDIRTVHFLTTAARYLHPNDPATAALVERAIRYFQQVIERGKQE